MRDLDIRLALLSYLQRLHGEDPSALIVEEVSICHGRSRVDMALVDERLHGFEIKSQVDSLSRLPGQLRDYGCVFDEVTLVIGLKHLTGVLKGLPSWCGIILAERVEGEVLLEPFRQGTQNLHRDPFSLAQLLWREEALEVLQRHGCDRGVRSKPRAALWQRLAESLALDDLAEEVREAMKARKSTWRATSRRRRRRVRRGRRRAA
jgi:hypothetical protein